MPHAAPPRARAASGRDAQDGLAAAERQSKASILERVDWAFFFYVFLLFLSGAIFFLTGRAAQYLNKSHARFFELDLVSQYVSYFTADALALALATRKEGSLYA